MSMTHKTRHSTTAALLFLAPFLSGGCGMFGDGKSDFERQASSKEAAKGWLEEHGAKFEDKQYPQGHAWSVDLTGAELSAETFEKLKHCGYVSELNFSGTSLDDELLAELDDVQITGVLVQLNLSGTQVTDAGIGELKTFGLLMAMDLTGTQVTPAGIEAFKKNRQANETIPAMRKTVAIKQ